jgi:F0F1-type ATP synthase membrane subunit b/b'
MALIITNEWWNYPGLELWKFLNLAVFVAAGFLLHRRFGRPIHKALRARGETIKRELLKARQERDQALAKLAEVDARFAGLETEIAKVKERNRSEAEMEQRRIIAATEEEITKIRTQAQKEIERAGKAARHELQRFAAEQSVRYAEIILRAEIGPEDDQRLTDRNVQELGGAAV